MSPIHVSVSSRDRALRISGLLRGHAERLESLTDTRRVATLPGVVILDVTDVERSLDPLNLFAVATSPAMISFIGGLDRFGATILCDQDRSGGVFAAMPDAGTEITEASLLPRGQ